MRWEMGWPMVMFIPGTWPEPRAVARAAPPCARSSCRSRPTSSSAALTSWACSSSSARPGPARWIPPPGWASSACSTRRPSRSDSSSDVPGRVTTLIVNVPSLNSGQERAPQERDDQRRRERTPAPPAIITLRCVQRPDQDGPVAPFQPAHNRPSPPSSTPALGSRYKHSAGRQRQRDHQRGERCATI